MRRRPVLLVIRSHKLMRDARVTRGWTCTIRVCRLSGSEVTYLIGGSGQKGVDNTGTYS